MTSGTIAGETMNCAPFATASWASFKVLTVPAPTIKFPEAASCLMAGKAS